MGKRSNPAPAFFLIANGGVMLLLLPYLLWKWAAILQLPAIFWVTLLASGLCQAVYFIALAYAYQAGDMSLAYPLARAIPVLLVAIFTLVLQQGERITVLALGGMVLISVGCIIMPLIDFKKIDWQAYRSLVTRFALVAALGTTGYTLIDDNALRQLAALPNLGMNTIERTLLFAELQTMAIVLFIGLYIIWRRAEQTSLQRIWQSGWRYAVVSGLIMFVTYGSVLYAYNLVSNVSYVSAFRQLSIPIGALLGLTIQREPWYRPKIIGTVIVFVGLIIVALA